MGERKLKQLQLLRRSLEFQQQEGREKLFQIHTQIDKMVANINLLTNYIQQYENHQEKQTHLLSQQFINHQAFIATLCQNASREKDALQKKEAMREEVIQTLLALAKKIETIEDRITCIQQGQERQKNLTAEQEELDLWQAHQYNQSDIKELA